MATVNIEVLAALKPTQRLSVMDLVEQAGIDVAPWRTTAEGRSVKNPRANPSYCYDWAFGSEKEGFAVCIWHGSLKIIDLPKGRAVVYNECFREIALGLDRKAIDRTEPAGVRNRARSQAQRARAFDLALQRSFRLTKPVKVIVIEGARNELAELGSASSTVSARKLDAENWYMHAYDNDTGDTLLVRGQPLESVELPAADVGPASVALEKLSQDADQTGLAKAAEAHPAPAAPGFVDQFSLPAYAAHHEVTTLVRDRSAMVRVAVLNRAQGACELCGQPGFVTASGSVYLETHHVVPLAEDGPDHPTNVVAICPQDHRRAHYARERDDIASRLKAILISKNV